MKSIDIHTHGIGGFDTRSSTVNDLLRIAEIHGAAGVSEIVLSIYPAPVQQMRQQMELVRQAMELQSQGSGVKGQARTTCKKEQSNSAADATNLKVLDRQSPLPNPPCPDAVAARILGVHLEGPFINPVYCGALDSAFFIDPKTRVYHELMDGFEAVIRTITVAPERRGAVAFIRRVTDMGILVSMGHSDATYDEAEGGFNAGARGITHLFNAMNSFHHRRPGLTGFGLLHKQIYVEIIADPFHLHVETLKLIFRMKEPDRVIVVSDSIKETQADGHGRITDASGRLKGGSTTVMGAAHRLIRLGFDKGMVISAVTDNPRSYLNLGPKVKRPGCRT